jgi:hypothetical protein
VFINTAPNVNGPSGGGYQATGRAVYGSGTPRAERYIDNPGIAINTLLALIYGLLALSIVVPAVGIVITLLLSVYGDDVRSACPCRWHDRSQVRSTVRWESVITSICQLGFSLACSAVTCWYCRCLTGGHRVTVPIHSDRLLVVASSSA